MSDHWIDDEDLTSEDVLARFETMGPEDTLAAPATRLLLVTVTGSTLPTPVWVPGANTGGANADPSEQVAAAHSNQRLTHA